jgi:hypothetical protein
MAAVPVSPGVLYPQPDVLQATTQSYPFTYDFQHRNVGGHNITNVVTTSNPAGGWNRGKFPAEGGQARFNLSAPKTMREPNSGGTQMAPVNRAY